MLYLFEAQRDPQGPTAVFLKSIEQKYNVTFQAVHKAHYALHTSYHIKSNDIGISVILSEFPGNCSSLVISGIQSFILSKDHYYNFLPILMHILDEFADNYAGVWASVTEHKEKLEAVGFTVCQEMGNPHSGNHNYYLFRPFKSKESANSEKDSE